MYAHLHGGGRRKATGRSGKHPPGLGGVERHTHPPRYADIRCYQHGGRTGYSRGWTFGCSLADIRWFFKRRAGRIRCAAAGMDSLQAKDRHFASQCRAESRARLWRVRVFDGTINLHAR